MANPYQIDWQPPNLAPGLSLLLNARNASRENERADQNAATQAEFARLNLQRENNRDYYERKKFEQDAGDRQEKAFASAKLMFQQGDKAGALSLLQRHGIMATPETGPATTTPAKLLTPADVLASQPQAQAPQEAVGASPQAPLTPLNVMAMAGMHRDDPMAHAGSTVPEEPPQMPQVAPPDVSVGHQGPGHAIEDLAPMELEPETTTPGGPTGAYSFRGQQGQDLGRYEPHGSMTTGFGPELDKLYESLVHGGADPTEARKDVFALYKNSQLESGRDKRLADAIAGRQGAQHERFDYGREMGLDREDKLSEAEKNRIAAMERAKVGGQYRVAASAPALKIDTANRQDMGTLRQGFKDWKNTVNLSIDSKSHKRLATAMSNLDSGNAMQQREAAESLVSIFKGGGQVTKASQDLLLKHLAGVVGDAQTWLQHAASGHFGEAELNVLKQATQSALAEEQEKLHAYHESAVDTFGPGSGYEQLGGNVNAMVKGAFRQFGYDSPDVYPQSAESVVLGSGKRPKAPGKSPGKQAPQTVTIRNRKTGETKEVPIDEARRMGAVP
jgi:hypothetical protein